MAFPFKTDLPLVSETGFNVPATDVADGSSAYGTVVASPATTWIAGNSDSLRCEKFLVVVNTGALTSTPDGLKLGLYKGTNSSGAGAALVTGTDTEWLTPAGNSCYVAEIAGSYISGSASDFYSLGLSSNGGGSTAVLASATALKVNPVHV